MRNIRFLLFMLLCLLSLGTARFAGAQNITRLSNNGDAALTYLYVETETMEIRPPLLAGIDEDASQGGYIYTPREPTVHFEFDIVEEGDYVLWARVQNGGAGFRIFVDGEYKIKWRMSPTSAAWHWVTVSDPKEKIEPLLMHFTPGRHRVSLEYAHNMDEPFRIDRLLLTDNLDYSPGRWVYPSLSDKPGGNFFVLEGEDALIHPPFETGFDHGAGNGKYLVLNCYYTTKEVYIPYDGNYKLWGRCLTPSGNTDSFFIGIGTTGQIHSWNNIGKKDGKWNWDYLRDRNRGGEMVIFELQKGMNTLIIKQREGGAKIDRILITNDMEYTPQ